MNQSSTELQCANPVGESQKPKNMWATILLGLIIEMSRDTSIPKLNQRGRCKTWHFTSVLAPTPQIHEDLNCIASTNPNVGQPHICLVKALIKTKVLSDARPGCVTYITWRFSRADAASWVSNARNKIRLSDLPFEGYMQSTDPLDLSRLHLWMQDATWENVNGKLSVCVAYQQFSAANDVFEFCNDGSPALSQGGRPQKVTAVSTGHSISILSIPRSQSTIWHSHLTAPTMIFSYFEPRLLRSDP